MAECAFFEDHELFFSITDKKGVIKSFNQVFVRVSEFKESELINKPHNIIRHPDMPKVVFKVLWDFIQDGRSIAAIVKNKSKSGKYYWVLAMAFPIAEGYLSIRLKPSDEICTLLEGLYGTLKSKEIGHSNLPEVQEILGKTLVTLGFKDYQDFMENLLFQELTKRDARLKEKGMDLTSVMSAADGSSSSLITEIKDSFDLMVGIETMLNNFSEQVKNIFAESRKVKFLTTNMSISTERLKEQGAVLSIISIKFGDISNEIRQGVTKINNQFSKFREILSRTIDSSDMFEYFYDDLVTNLLSVFTITYPKCIRAIKKVVL